MAKLKNENYCIAGFTNLGGLGGLIFALASITIPSRPSLFFIKKNVNRKYSAGQFQFHMRGLSGIM